MILKMVLKIVLFTVWLFLLVAVLASIILGYYKSVFYLLKCIGQEGRIRNIFTLISLSEFYTIAGILFVFSCLTGYVFLKLEYFCGLCRRIVAFIVTKTNYLFNEIKETELKWILIIPLFSSIYFACTMPVSYDEAFTYLEFTSKSPIYSLSYYPVPNNHVLHSFLTGITKHFPFSTLFCLRITSIVISFITWLLSYFFIKKQYSQNTALLITGISAMLFMSIYYSYMSRGYGLTMFFFVGALYAAFNIIYNEKTNYWIAFLLCNVLGVYTIPSFLYASIFLNVIILFNKKEYFLKILVVNVLILCFTVLLYSPILIVSGVDALINNHFVKPIARLYVLEKLPCFFSDTIREIFGFNSIWILLLLAISAFFIIKNKNVFVGKLMLIFLLFPFLILLTHSVIPFPRTFNYYAFVLVFLIVAPFDRFLNALSEKMILAIVILLQMLLLMNFYSKIYAYETFNISYKKINDKIIGNKTYFVCTDLFEVNLMYELKVNGYTSETIYHYLPHAKINADTIPNYDYVIIDKIYDKTQNRKPMYSDTLTHVYAR